MIQGDKPLATLPSLASVKTQDHHPYLWGPRENSINAWFVTHIVQ